MPVNRAIGLLFSGFYKVKAVIYLIKSNAKKLTFNIY